MHINDSPFIFFPALENLRSFFFRLETYIGTNVLNVTTAEYLRYDVFIFIITQMFGREAFYIAQTNVSFFSRNNKNPEQQTCQSFMILTNYGQHHY